jgi:hypothetical protein
MKKSVSQLRNVTMGHIFQQQGNSASVMPSDGESLKQPAFSGGVALRRVQNSQAWPQARRLVRDCQRKVGCFMNVARTIRARRPGQVNGQVNVKAQGQSRQFRRQIRFGICEAALCFKKTKSDLVCPAVQKSGIFRHSAGYYAGRGSQTSR